MNQSITEEQKVDQNELNSVDRIFEAQNMFLQVNLSK